MLKGVSRPADGESFCIVERLLQVARDIFQQCRAMGPETVTNIAEVQAICKIETGVNIFWPIRSTKNLDSLKDVAIMFDMGHLKRFNTNGRQRNRHGSKESGYTTKSKHRSSSSNKFNSASRSMINA